MNIIHEIRAMLDPIKRRILSIVGRAVLKQVYEDQGIQLVRIDDTVGDVRDRVQRMQDFGFSSHPPLESEVLVLFPGGDRTAGIIIKAEDRSTRVKNLSVGESVVYNAHGLRVFLKEGAIHIGQSDSSTENLVLGQELKSLLSQTLAAIASHTHTGNMGSPTSAPLNAGTFTSLKSSPVDDEGILSDVAFTEKGN